MMATPKKYQMLFDIDKQLNYGKSLTYPQCRFLKNVVAKIKANIPAELALQDDNLEPTQTGKCSPQYRLAKMQRDRHLRQAFENLPPTEDSNEGKLTLFSNLVSQVVKNYANGGPPMNGFELHIHEILKAGACIPRTTKQLREIIFNK